MKQKDIALIIVIAVVSAVLSIAISKTVFSSATAKNDQAEVVQVITADFEQPNKAYFNDQAFDPTRQITIEQNSNTDPFKATGSQ